MGLLDSTFATADLSALVTGSIPRRYAGAAIDPLSPILDFAGEAAVHILALGKMERWQHRHRDRPTLDERIVYSASEPSS